MQSAIDFGKNFLTQYFNKKDADATSAFLSDDIIWITPNDIRHLKNVRYIREFLRESLEEDPKAYTVDVASIRSAPGLDPINITVYDVNLIPKHEESSVNLRVTLGMRQDGVGFSIIYVGMSRKYLRTDTEQIRGFADALPGGIMTLTALGNDIRVMYVNGWFLERLDEDEAVIYERMDQNVFYMMPDEDQKRMATLVAEMAALRHPKPLSMQVSLCTKEGLCLPKEAWSKEKAEENKAKYTVPCHMSICAPYKDGNRTVMYLLFDELTDVVRDNERERKKEEKARKELEDQLQKATDQSGMTALQDELKQAKAELEEARSLASEEAEAAEALIKAKLEQASAEQKKAIDKAKKQVADQFSATWKEEKAKHAKERDQLRQQLEALQKAIDAAESREKELSEAKASQEEAAQKAEKEYQDRILKLEWKINEIEKKAAEDQTTLQSRLDAEKAEALQQAESAAKERETTLTREKDEVIQKERDLKAQLEGTVLRQQRELSRQETALSQKEVEQRILAKEKDKSICRMQSLLKGQMGSIQSAAKAAKDEERLEELHLQMDKMAEAAAALPGYMQDLAEISAINPNERTGRQETVFSLRSCLDLVRLVIWPQCRKKGIAFSVEMTEGMPDQVAGAKAGLELAFLCILENAIENTDNGGRITLTASADAPVRGSAYYHFHIKDNGNGIAEDKLPILFDQPESELAIARKVMSTMGGSIQVRSKEGEGASFEVRVSLAVAN